MTFSIRLVASAPQFVTRIDADAASANYHPRNLDRARQRYEPIEKSGQKRQRESKNSEKNKKVQELFIFVVLYFSSIAHYVIL